MKNKYPECEKMQAVQEQSQELGLFLEWLNHKYYLCKWQDSYKEFYGEGSDDYIGIPEGYYPIHISIPNILAEYFHIDMEKVNKEQAQILVDIRKKDK